VLLFRPLHEVDTVRAWAKNFGLPILPILPILPPATALVVVVVVEGDA
jgi:hypothetical protein